ncbi:hypothetical protein HYX00_00385 [Candidatus Woesearchaeota archaeon]|nr:hypothetical protein [Candidatus Woesearchaeota archaeon]
MVNKLPEFEGYTVDVRLRQFRRVHQQSIEFIDFDSIEGERILSKYRKYLDSKGDTNKSNQS